MAFAPRFVIFAVVLLLFSGVAQAGNIIVEPTEYNVDLIGGDTIIRPITITWTGETTVVGFIETDIAPDGKGIDVTYSEDPVVLYPGIPNTINMTIATAINLVPGDYVITTLVFTEIEKVIEYRSRGGGGTTTIYETIEVENITRINMLLDIIQQLKDRINETEGNCTEQILLLTGIIDALDEMIDSIEDTQPEDAKEDDWWLPFIVFLAIAYIILVIAIVYLYHKFRVLKSKKDIGEKKNENERNRKRSGQSTESTKKKQAR